MATLLNSSTSEAWKTGWIVTLPFDVVTMSAFGSWACIAVTIQPSIVVKRIFINYFLIS
ncbi:MAG TPA: hypothetical protein VIJ95_13345 [Hanamia sp.]